VQAAGLVLDAPAAAALLRAAPVIAGVLGGALLFPLAKTILESFDGSRPFLGRLVDNQAEPWSLARGAVAAGAVAWYFDAAQLEVVRQKFQAYAAVHYPAAGRPVVDYVICPLLSEWGRHEPRARDRGARLLYDESLSGVINWSLAAPLFGVNLVLLTALIRRSWAPLRDLASPQGLAGLAETRDGMRPRGATARRRERSAPRSRRRDERTAACGLLPTTAASSPTPIR
jgi:cyclic beta-1,2-glucan synthetase